MARTSPLQQQAAPNPTKSRISNDLRASSEFVAIQCGLYGAAMAASAATNTAICAARNAASAFNAFAPLPII